MPTVWDENEKRIVTVPNALTLLRVCFLPPIFHFLGKGDAKSDLIAALLMTIGACTDGLDGLVARRYKQTSNLGRVLDPVIDKIYMISIMFFLVVHKNLPLLYVAAVLTRDVVIVMGGIYVILRKQFVSEANVVGKFTAASFLAVIVTYTLSLEPLTRLCMWVSLCLIVLSAASYGRVFLRLMSSEQASQADSGKEGFVS